MKGNPMIKRQIILFVVVAISIPAIALGSGKTDYNAKCASCHGANGNVQTEKAKALKMDVKKLALKVSRMTRAEMITRVEEGKGKMPAYQDELTKEQITAIADYVMAFRKK
jgi:mono/diheme cytochrome c family protein